MLDLETRAEQRSDGCRVVDRREEGRDRGRGEEDELARGREERAQRLRKVAVRDLRGSRSARAHAARDGAFGPRGPLSPAGRLARTSFKKGGSAMAMSTLPRSSSGKFNGSSKSYLTNLSPATSPNRASYSNRYAEGSGFVCWKPTYAVGHERKAMRVVGVQKEYRKREKRSANEAEYLCGRLQGQESLQCTTPCSTRDGRP